MTDARVVVVTGASTGVGRATTRLFAARGDAVALVARGERGLASAAREVESAGGTAMPIAVDVTDHDALAGAANRVERELGPIDDWVNNAFSTVFAPFTEIRPEEFRRVTEVTYLGYVHGTRIALRHMLPVAAARSSRWDRRWHTGGIPLQSAARREYWVGLSTMAILLANKLAPGLLDRYLARTGYQAQQTSTPDDPNRPSNLWEPVDDDTDFGAHGRFDNRAKS